MSSKGTLIIRPKAASLKRETEVFGKMDAFCVIKFAGQKQQTTVAKDQGKKPKWEDSLTFKKLGQAMGEDQIEVILYDSETMSKNDLIGKTIISLKKTPIYQKGGKWNQFYQLEYQGKNAGEINIEIQLDLVNEWDNNNQGVLKILMIGPENSGKTSIINFITEKGDQTNKNYIPTMGTRIVEYEKESPKIPNRPDQEKILIQFWDVSGSSSYEQCWPAIQKDSNGIILVYNADNPKSESEVENWINQFPKKIGMSSAMCIGFAHHPNGRPIKGQSKPPKGVSNLKIYDTQIENGAETIIPAFDKFYNSLVIALCLKQENEENKILQQ